MLSPPLMVPVVADLDNLLKLLVQANLHLSRRQLESAVDHWHINWGTAPAFVKKLQQALDGTTVLPFLREHCCCKDPFFYNEAKLENAGKIAYATDCLAANSVALRDGQNLAALSSAFQALGTSLPPVPVLQRTELLEMIQTGHLATILDFAKALPPIPSFVHRNPPRFRFARSETDDHGVKNQFQGYSASVTATQFVSPDSFFNTGYKGIDKCVPSINWNNIEELPVLWEVLSQVRPPPCEPPLGLSVADGEECCLLANFDIPWYPFNVLKDRQTHIERQVESYLSSPSLQEQFIEVCVLVLLATDQLTTAGPLDLLQLLHDETQDDRGRLPLSKLEELWVVLAHSLTLAIMSDCPVVFALNATAAIADISAELKDDGERACFKVKQQFAHALVSLIYHTDHHVR
ncbi:hypothetical protein JCM11251_006400 [Rhodosporidiobolus azoricus]